MIWQTQDPQQWHSVFALVPHWLPGHRTVWLQRVERKMVGQFDWTRWIYRLPGEGGS